MDDQSVKLGLGALEIKTFQLEVKDVTDDGQFEGYASVFGNVDSYGDVVEPGAFAKTLKENPQVPILWQHDPFEPIGVSVEMEEDEKGLRVIGQLELEVQRAREARALMKRRAMKGLSIGYETIKREIEKVDSARGFLRRLKELRLWEFSPVTFPANQLAMVSAVKSGLIGAHNPFGEDGERSARLLVELATELKGRDLSEVEAPLVAEAAKVLQALLETAEPGKSTPPPDGAADELDEPALATLRKINDDLRAIARKEA